MLSKHLLKGRRRIRPAFQDRWENRLRSLSQGGQVSCLLPPGVSPPFRLPSSLCLLSPREQRVGWVGVAGWRRELQREHPVPWGGSHRKAGAGGAAEAHVWFCPPRPQLLQAACPSRHGSHPLHPAYPQPLPLLGRQGRAGFWAALGFVRMYSQVHGAVLQACIKTSVPEPQY